MIRFRSRRQKPQLGSGGRAVGGGIGRHSDRGDAQRARDRELASRRTIERERDLAASATRDHDLTLSRELAAAEDPKANGAADFSRRQLTRSLMRPLAEARTREGFTTTRGGRVSPVDPEPPLPTPARPGLAARGGAAHCRAGAADAAGSAATAGATTAAAGATTAAAGAAAAATAAACRARRQVSAVVCSPRQHGQGTAGKAASTCTSMSHGRRRGARWRRCRWSTPPPRLGLRPYRWRCHRPSRDCRSVQDLSGAGRRRGVGRRCRGRQPGLKGPGVDVHVREQIHGRLLHLRAVRTGTGVARVVEAPGPLHRAGAEDERAAVVAVEREVMGRWAVLVHAAFVHQNFDVVSFGGREADHPGRPPSVVEVLVPLIPERSLGESRGLTRAQVRHARVPPQPQVAVGGRDLDRARPGVHLGAGSRQRVLGVRAPGVPQSRPSRQVPVQMPLGSGPVPCVVL